jgi:hypothetical protein
MATRFAVANGNWSSGSTWDNGAVPLNADDVFANARTVTIDQNITVNRITNAQPNIYGAVFVPDIATPKMTSNTTPSGIAFASSTAGGGTAWGVFDQNRGTYWQSGGTNSGFVGYQFPSGKIIKQYAIFTAATIGNNPKDWTFQGSNDGSTYTTIETVTGFSSVASTWYVRNVSSNTTSYTYYRMNITAIQTLGSYPLFYELQMTESTGSVYASGSGGSFLLNNGITLTATFPTGGIVPFAPSTATPLLIISGNNSATIIGDMYPTQASFSGWPAGGQGITLSMTQTSSITITGSVSGNSGFNNSAGINHASIGTLRILGRVYAGASQGGVNFHYGINMAAVSSSTYINGGLTGTPSGTNGVVILNAANQYLEVTGSTTGPGGSSLIICGGFGNARINVSGSHIGTSGTFLFLPQTSTGIFNMVGEILGGGIFVGGPMTCIITGSVTKNTATTPIQSTGASTIIIDGPLYNTSNVDGSIVSSTSINATLRLRGPFLGFNNTNPIFSPRIQLFNDSTPYYEIQSDTFPKDVTFYDVAYTSSLPAQTNVRSSSLYGGTNEFSGSMVVPSSSNVRYGVPVDATTGSSTLTPQDIFDYAVSSLTGSNTIGSRLQNISTVQTTAATIAAFKGK